MNKFNFSEFIDEFYKKVDGIPFENSDFQNLVYVLLSQKTPARLMRALSLQMEGRIAALRHVHYESKRDEVKMKRFRAILADETESEYNREMAEIDLEEIMSKQIEKQKLIKDAEHTLMFLKSFFDKMPVFSREDFESEEHQHFSMKLESAQRRMALNPNTTGIVESLENMTIDAQFIANLLPEVFGGCIEKFLEIRKNLEFNFDSKILLEERNFTSLAQPSTP